MRWWVALVWMVGCASPQVDARVNRIDQDLAEQRRARTDIEDEIAAAHGARLARAKQLELTYDRYHQASLAAEREAIRVRTATDDIERIEAELDRRPLVSMKQLVQLRRVTASTIASLSPEQLEPFRKELDAVTMPRNDDIRGRNALYGQLHALRARALETRASSKDIQP